MLTLTLREELPECGVSLHTVRSTVAGIQPAEHVKITNTIGQVQDLEVTGGPRRQHGDQSSIVDIGNGDASCNIFKPII